MNERKPKPGDVVEYWDDVKLPSSDDDAWSLRTVLWADKRVIYFVEGGCAVVANPIRRFWRWPVSR